MKAKKADGTYILVEDGKRVEGEAFNTKEEAEAAAEARKKQLQERAGAATKSVEVKQNILG
jgi:hypothetical protein